MFNSYLKIIWIILLIVTNIFVMIKLMLYIYWAPSHNCDAVLIWVNEHKCLTWEKARLFGR